MLAVNDRISDLLSALVATGATPGAVVVAGTRDSVLVESAVGRLSYAADADPVTPGTIYDLASLTKVIVTTPLVMRLYEAGRLDLEAPVGLYVPEFAGDAKDRVTVADLLAHCGGLLWWTDLHRQARANAVPTEEVARFYLRRICELPLDYEPRTDTVYSDLGFILLGTVLERTTGTPLDRLAAEEVFAPLGMRDIHYNPPAALTTRIAPTEDDPERGGVLRGVVHDENAWRLGGVAPHAGLFATARSLVPFAQMWLAEGTVDRRGGSDGTAGGRSGRGDVRACDDAADGRGGRGDARVRNGTVGRRRVFESATIHRFRRRARLAGGSSRALGWDTPAPGSSCGNRFSPASFGHTGFTGTSLWIDAERDLFVVLLTNRVHPTRDNTRLADLRPPFHDELIDALTSKS